MLIKEFFNKIYLSIYLKLMGTEEELKQINNKFDNKHKQHLENDENTLTDIDELDKLSIGTYVDDQGKAHTFAMPMPERFWKYLKYKSKNYDDDIFRKKNLLFTGQVSPEERKKVMKQIAKSEAYRNKKGK